AGVMVAARRSDVDDLNRRARMHLAAAARLHGPAITTASGLELQVGDQVMTLRNDRRLGVINGTRGRVTRVDSVERAVSICTRDGREVTLPSTYLDGDHVGHAYAITGHKAQGASVDRAWVLGSEAIYREWGYVALSRARHGTRLYLVGPTVADDHHPSRPWTVPVDPLVTLADALQLSHRHELAYEHTAGAREDLGALTDLRRRLIATMPRPVDSHVRLVGAQFDQAHQQLARLDGETARVEEHLARTGRGLRRLSKRHKIEQTQRDLTRLRGDAAAWEQQLARLSAERTALDERSRHRESWAADNAPTSSDMRQPSEPSMRPMRCTPSAKKRTSQTPRCPRSVPAQTSQPPDKSGACDYASSSPTRLWVATGRSLRRGRSTSTWTSTSHDAGTGCGRPSSDDRRGDNRGVTRRRQDAGGRELRAIAIGGRLERTAVECTTLLRARFSAGACGPTTAWAQRRGGRLIPTDGDAP
ncbi:MAG: hypothetical protein M3276_08735, partial [Actinomycetota bacterium]|nr:hypothetical protein [Actinomycetota bacterium]